MDDALVSMPEPETFIQQWLDRWNAHDIEAVLAHFAEDVVFTSPVAARVLQDSGGVVRGKDALRAYWTLALQRVPDLQFELVGTYVGVSAIVINYRNQVGGLVNEVLIFRNGLVREGHGTYLGAGAHPAGISS